MASNTPSTGTRNKFARTALAIARQFGQGWNDEVAQEYTKLLPAWVDLTIAEDCLRALARQFERMPTASEVSAEASRRTVGPDMRWIVTVAGVTKRMRLGHNPLDYGYRPGSGDVVMAPKDWKPNERERLFHWSECAEGREFAALWQKIAGTKLGKSLKEISGGQSNAAADSAGVHPHG